MAYFVACEFTSFLELYGDSIMNQLLLHDMRNIC